MLHGKDIKLKLLEPEDLLLLVKWKNSSYEEFYEFPLSNYGQNLWFENYSKNTDFLFIIFKEAERIGSVGLSSIDHRNKSAEFGRFVIDGFFRGNGFGKEAIYLILNYGFNHLNLHRIYLDTFESNVKVIRLYENAGFKKEGVKYEHIYQNGKYHNLVCMSILNKNFKNEN